MMEKKTIEEIIELYNPFNASKLTQEEVAAMADFDRDTLKALAAAYPNEKFPNAYLILKDKSKADNKQLNSLSTWKNLYELRKVGQNNFVAASFKSIFKPKTAPVPVAKVQDLTNKAAKEELKTSTAQTATKDKVKEPGTGDTANEQTAVKDDKANTGNTNPPADTKTEKPLNKMNVADLTVKFKELFGKDPEPGSTKAKLIAEIETELENKK
jgi:hypothetical protein